MFAAIFRRLRRLRRPAGLGLAAALPTLLLAALFWYEVVGYAYTPAHRPWELLLRRGEMTAGNLLRAHGRGTPLRPDVVFLGIDDASLKLDGLWPEEIAASRALQLMSAGKGDLNWSREVEALLLERLVSAGARLVIFDMVFPNPSQGDDAFRSALDRFRGHVVIGAKFVQTPGDESWQPPASTLIADATGDPRVGYVNYRPDFDGAIRLVPFASTQMAYNGRASQGKEPVYASLVAAALRQLGQGDKIPADGQSRLFRYTDLRHHVEYPPRPLWEIFSDATWQQNYQGGRFFRDKIVIVGATAPILHDIQPTPYGEIDGPELQLQALTAALQQDYLRLTSIWTDFALILAAGALSWALGLAVRPPVTRLLLLGAASAAYCAVLQLLYNRTGLMPLAFAPLLAFNGSGLTGLIGEYTVERAEKARVRGVLDRLVSKDIVRELLSDRERYAQLVRGQRRCVTVLFSDIRGFTTLSEGAADPAAFIAQLNEYLCEMVEVVFEHRGTLDKFIGDAVMAIWGSIHTEGAETDARLAVAAALEMRTRLAALNARWAAEGKLTLAIGIGLNYGEVIVGGLGSEKSKMEITVMGDAVNTASRLEGLTKEYGLDLLIGEGVAQRTSEAFRLRSVDLVRVKGKKKPTEVMTVLGPLDEVPSAAREELLANYEDAILHYRRRDFAAAERLFEQCVATEPGDKLAALYVTRCRDLLAEGASAEDADVIRTMTSK